MVCASVASTRRAYLFIFAFGVAGMLETGHFQSWPVPMPEFDFTAKGPPSFIWSSTQRFPPYTLSVDSLLITPGCDARYASVCAVQYAIKMVTQARLATCSLLMANASSNRVAINLLNSTKFIPADTKYFGLFLLDSNFRIVVDQLRPSLVGQPIDGLKASGLAYQHGLRANMNFSVGHGGGFVNRLTVRLRSDFGTSAIPVQSLAYMEGCPGLSYFLGVDIGRDPMPLVPNCPSTSNELCAVRNVNRIVGLMLVDFLALRYTQEFEMFEFSLGFTDRYRVNDFYGWSAEASTVPLGHQSGLKDTIGTFLTHNVDTALIGKNYSDLGDARDALFGVGALQGGDWRAYYWQTPDLGPHFKVTLVVGAIWDGIPFYLSSMFSHIPRAPAEGPQCLECNASEATPCAFKNAERLAGHHQADFLQSANLSDMLWRTTHLKWLGASHNNSVSIETGGVRLDRVFPDGFFVEVFNNAGVCLASGFDPSRIGRNMSQMARDAGLKINGTTVFQTLLRKGRGGGGWQQYIWDRTRYARATILYKWGMELLSVVSVGSSATDGETCTASYAEPCADKIVRGYVGAAMFAVANSNNTNVLPNLAIITRGQQPYGDPEGGFRVQIYDENWNCMSFLGAYGGVCPTPLNLAQRAALDTKLQDGGAWVEIIDDRGDALRAFVVAARKSLGTSFNSYDAEIRYVSTVKADPPPPRCTVEDARGCPPNSSCGSAGRCICDFGFRPSYEVVPGLCSSMPAWTMTCIDVRGQMCDELVCSPCSAGLFCPSGDPLPCNLGFYCPLGSSQPKDCPAGMVTSVAGAMNESECQLCPPGSIQSPTMRCHLCSPGMYQEAAGQSVCVRCPRGTTASTEGQDSCDACPEGRTTDGIGFVDVSSCSCPPGTYEASLNRSCVNCGLGAVCTGFGSLPASAPGYQVYDLRVDGLDVYRCASPKRCPGGPSPSCALGRTGIACDACLPGMSGKDDGTCAACGGSDKTPFALVFVLCVALVTGVYFFIDLRPSVTTNHMVLLFVICCGQITTLNQTLAVAVKVGSFTWVDPLSPLLRAIKVLTFDIELVRVGCVVLISPFLQYITRVCIPIVTFAYVIFVHLANMLIIRRRSIRSRFASLTNTEGQFIMIFFISIITMITEPLQCLRNPNGLWTMVSSRSVICWEGEEHRVMSATAVVMLLGALCFVGLALWVLLQYRFRICVGDVGFLHTWSFMLFRFRPEARWCLLFFLGRSVSLSLIPTVPVALLQVMGMHVVGLFTIFVALIVQPWRVNLANTTEFFGGIWLMMFMMLTAFMVDNESPAVISTLAVIFIALVIAILPATVCYSFIRRHNLKYRKRFHFFVSHHKLGAGCLARLIKHELALRPLKGAVFLDSDNLETLDTLFDIVAHQTRIVVALASANLLQRPWCVGEITVAVNAKIGMYVILCSDFVAPTPQYIHGIEEHVEFREISSYGVGIDLARSALKRFLELPFIVLPDPLTNVIVQIVVDGIMKNNFEIDFSAPRGKAMKASSDPSLVIINDLYMREAAASGLLLIAMLGPKIRAVDNSDGIVLWFETHGEDQQESQSVKSFHSIILLCSNNCWVAPQYLRAVLECSTTGLPVLPVVVDANYAYPTQSFYDSLEGLVISLTLVSGRKYMGGEMSLFVKQVFMTISVRFDPQGDSHQLWKQADDILRRSRNLFKRSVTKLSSSFRSSPKGSKRQSEESDSFAVDDCEV